MMSVCESDRDMARYQEVYSASSFEPTQALMRKGVVLENLKKWKPRSIVEVGCGRDSLFNHYRNFDRFVVIEPGAEFAAQAREQAGDDDRITVVEDFAENVALSGTLQNRSFDVVLVSGLLHEVSDPVSLMAGVALLVGPEGHVHVNVPNARSLHRLLAFEMGLINDLHEMSGRQIALQQHRTYDMKSLKDFCQRLGFQVTGSGSFFIKPFSHDQMSLLSEVGILDQRMLNGLMKLEKHLPGLGSEIYVNLKLA